MIQKNAKAYLFIEEFLKLKITEPGVKFQAFPNSKTTGLFLFSGAFGRGRTIISLLKISYYHPTTTTKNSINYQYLVETRICAFIL